MIPNNLEEDGNVTGNDGPYLTPKAFKKKLKYEVIKKKSRRFIPKEIAFPKYLFNPVKLGLNDFRPFKLVKNSNGVIIMASPMVKVALESIERGRSSFDKEEKLPLLVKYLKEKVPNDVRGIIKKGLSFGKITNTEEGYIPVNIIINSADDENLYIKTGSAGEESTIQPKIYESIIDMVIKSEILKEVSYNNFKSNIKQRSKKEQFQKAISEIKNRLNEVDRLMKYTSKIKTDLNESEVDYRHDKQTKKICNSLSETLINIQKKMDEIIKDKMEEKINQPDYEYYVFDPGQDKIISGFAYQQDAIDQGKAYKEENGFTGLKIYSKRFLISKSKDPNINSNWGTDIK